METKMKKTIYSKHRLPVKFGSGGFRWASFRSGCVRLDRKPPAIRFDFIPPTVSNQLKKTALARKPYNEVLSLYYVAC